MKYLEDDTIDQVSGRRITPADAFCFRCHAGLSCFNRCCRNLNLFLYPYDAARLRRRLGVTSAEFLDAHADVVMRENAFFPEVLLRMADNAEKTCPFLSDAGCTVYPDRPDTCRFFPVERGLFYDAEKRTSNLVYYFRPPDFCLGQNETSEWTIETWAEDQEADDYADMTARWAELRRLFQGNPWGPEGFNGRKGRMAFMAAYNLDEFREFVLNSSFLKRFKIKKKLVYRLRDDDAELLKLGFDWIRYFLWGMKGKVFK